MKNLLIAISLLLLGLQASAQIADGSIAPNFTGVSMQGDSIELYDYLQDGKVVILDVMAVWCPPCWSWHTGKIFEETYQKYGPHGTGELEMIMLEADPSTAEAWLRGGGNSLGDWVTGTEYPVLNHDGINDAYGITAYPTIFAVYPDSTIYTIQRNIPSYYQDIVHQRTSARPGVELHQYPHFGNTEICKSSSIDVELQNLGDQEITEVVYNVVADGEVVANGTRSVSIGSRETLFLDIPVQLTENMFSDGSADIIVTTSTSNDVNIANNESMFAVTAAAEGASDSIYIAHSTDLWPSETKLVVTDGSGDVVLEVQYVGNGNTAGGRDANKTFNYVLDLQGSDSQCWNFAITDSYGDGSDQYSAGQPRPGIVINNDQNEAIVSRDFVSTDKFSARSITNAELVNQVQSGVNAPLANAVNAYPNPVLAGAVVTVTLNQLNSSGTVQARLYNTLGQTVYTFAPKAAGSQMSFELPTVISGVHFLELSAAEGSSTVRLNVQ